MRLIYDTEARRLARRELEWIDQFDATLTISQREADLVADSRLRAKVHVFPPILPSAPSMITTSSFVQNGPAQSPGQACPGLWDANREHDNSDVARTGPVVGFVGAMDYKPNIDAACWLAHDIWPRVRQSCPEAQLWIVGRSPTQAVRDLAADPSITVTGTVTDVDDYFRRMRVHVAPLRIARGVQMKVIAAMAVGRPCVVTSGVADGIAARGGRELIVADSPAAFAKCVTDLLDNPERAAAIGRAGRRFVDRLQPEQAIRRLEALLTMDQNSERDDADPICSPLEPAVSSQECVSIS